MNVINCISEKEKKKFIKLLDNEGFFTVYVDSTGCLDLASFYKKLMLALPLGIPLSGNVHWDAFLDSVGEGITQQPHKKIALLWDNAQVVMNKSVSDFLTVTDVIKQLADNLGASVPSYIFIFVIFVTEKKFDMNLVKINPNYLRIILAPLAGYVNEPIDANNEELIKAFIINKLKPEFEKQSEQFRENTGMALSYYLTVDKINLQELFGVSLSGFDHPLDLKMVFIWLKEVLFPRLKPIYWELYEEADEALEA